MFIINSKKQFYSIYSLVLMGITVFISSYQTLSSMKKNYKTFIKAVFVTLIVFISGCDSTALKNSTDMPKMFSVIDGRLSFKDQKIFETYMQKLFTQKDLKEVSIKGFTSLKSSVSQNTESESKANPLGDIPMSDQFKSVLNSKGEFQVGNSVYVVANGLVSEYEASDYQSNSLSKQSGQIRKEIQILGTKDCEVTYVAPTNERYRLKGLAFNTDYLVYREAGAKTYWQKARKRLFGGTDWNTTSDRLSHVFVSVSGELTTYALDGTPLGPFLLPGAGSDTDTDGEVTKLGHYEWGGIGFGVNMTSQHVAHLSNGASISCSNSYQD